MRKGFVYIMSNKNRTTFYIGVTNAIKRRILEHKTGKGSAFTKKYNLVDLVYFEKIEGLEECILREKQLKNWHRDWKINLIKEDNPEMVDLAADWYVEVEGNLVVKSGWQEISRNQTDAETSSA
ncbi:MAG: GIY-YIG nuclease family protein [Prolixibacteraceae bacterium]